MSQKSNSAERHMSEQICCLNKQFLYDAGSLFFPPDTFLSSSIFFYTSETPVKNSLQAVLKVKHYAEDNSLRDNELLVLLTTARFRTVGKAHSDVPHQIRNSHL